MAKRKIIKIDEAKCNGCGLCIPNCPEGALRVIGGKLRLVSDLFCDGLGACIGHCPQGAISVIEREAQEYDETRVMENIARQGKEVIEAHLSHLKEHNQEQYLKQALDYLRQNKINISLDRYEVAKAAAAQSDTIERITNERSSVHSVSNWPLQITLVPVTAPYFNDAELLIAADCVPFAYADFHRDLLDGKTLMIGCPKLDDTQAYTNKLTQIFKNNNIKSITCAHMEVPCCFGLNSIINKAISDLGRDIPYQEVVIGISGSKLK